MTTGPPLAESARTTWLLSELGERVPTSTLRREAATRDRTHLHDAA